MGKIFNISSSNCFVDVLANKLLEDYKDNLLDLADVLILLPNRRACRSLSEAFVRLKGLRPTILPQMKAMGDIKEDEIVLSGINIEAELMNIPPVIEPVERKMLFMRLIMKRYEDFGLERISLSQACSLAQELGDLIDIAQMHNLDWDNLNKLVPEEYASHWQETLKFLAIITKYWPEILNERGVVDSGWRKNKLIEVQAEIWKKQKPKQRIIVAGTTAVSPAMKKLVKEVLQLEKGEVWLYGLDVLLEEEAFESIDETHPQFELKQLIDFLGVKRDEIKKIVVSRDEGREKLISEIMRPAEYSDEWRNIKDCFDKKSLEGLKLVECSDQRTEALSIALLIRKALQKKDKTIALITPDRVLARRVASELLRWNIFVDDSAGIPLANTKWGIFMRLCAEAVLPNVKKDQLLACMKNSMCLFGKNKEEVNKLVYYLDKEVFRKKEKNEEAELFWNDFQCKAKDFASVFAKDKDCLSNIIRKHILFAESLADSMKVKGAENLWRNEDGETGALFINEWIDKADILGDINTSEYISLFETMMSGVVVRNKTFSGRNVRILGPIEARLSHFDMIILGGCNEGVWPVLPDADPWMSRPMKKEFGLELPEKQIGVLGLDFSNLLGAENIYLTRAKMSGGTPTIKSRWWMRLETVLQAVDFDKENILDREILDLAEFLDAPDKQIKINAPSPKPPVEARPRKMSASAFEKLLRDPYGVFAEYILNLKPLEDLDKETDARDFGNLVHKVLENFSNKYSSEYPENAEQQLIELGTKELEDSDFANEKKVFWYPKMVKMMKWIAENENIYRKEVRRVNSEVWGSVCFENLPGGIFEIYAKADRIDETIDGKVNIIDYKTGQARTVAEIKKGYAPQLPIEGIIAKKGGFSGIKKADVNSLMYWKLGSKTVQVNEEVNGVLSETEDRIIEVINLFDFETTGYLSRPNPKSAPQYSDYEHLARVKEWSVKEDGEDE